MSGSLTGGFHRAAAIAGLVVLVLCGFSRTASAHCDTLDGPVVAAARQALDQGNVKLALIWVSESDEAELKAAFDRTVAVRRFDLSARNMADTYFFETLVRLHRQGEGAPYNGLKPAGQDLGPAIPAADQAIATGNLEPVTGLLTEALQSGLREQYGKVQARKNYDRNDVAAGREYVEAYVEYVHYVERIYEAATQGAHGHYEEAAEAPATRVACVSR